MAADLFERDEPLAALDQLLVGVASGAGRIALVSGEAGIGKTSLVERFLARHQSEARTLWGACEALFTPRPLGPLYDIARQARTPLRALLDGEVNRATLFAAVLDELADGPTATIVVFEDIQWADEATLDLLTFLARRIDRTRSLLVLTYRDDELSRDHPLRLVLGDLPARHVTRLHLRPLSEGAVAVMAERANRSAAELYAVTGGNPFFLSEVLASDTPGAPTSVSDAVLAKVARRSLEARRLLELVAVAPRKIDRRVVEAVDDAYSLAIEECLGAGLLQSEDSAVGYRHELARQAVENAHTPTRRRTLHAEMLHALLTRGVEQAPLALLVHHAAQAEEGALVLRFAPEAAQQASAQGAHREAVAHYMTALRYANSLDSERRGDLLDGFSQELYLAGHIEEAVPPCEEALAIWRTLGRQEQVGRDLRRLSRFSWFRFRNAEAERYGVAAVTLLESLPPGRELAMAYANLSNLRMVESDTAVAVDWGDRAIALAERLEDTETVCYALNSVGTALLEDGDETGWDQLERSLQLALEQGYEEHVARAYSNLTVNTLARRDYAHAGDYVQRGMAYCAERDLGTWGHYLREYQAHIRLDLGDWAGADEDAAAVLRLPWADGTGRLAALLILGVVRARRGDPGAERAFDEARDLAAAAGVLRTGAVESVLSVDAARAEWCWLQGDHKGCVAEAETHWELALKQRYPWYVGELAIWRWRCGALDALPEGLPAHYALQIAGDWRAAAALWERMGCLYEQALALMGGDTPGQRAALDIFERLGAAPAAEIVRRRLRAAGVRGLPRGPHRATRSNPLGLTPRQFEILLLLAEGLQNAEIGDRLSTTPKTVEHHVSAVLAKLDARTRAEAVRVAARMGLIPQTVTAPTEI